MGDLPHNQVEEITGELLCMRQAPEGKSSRCSLPGKGQHVWADAWPCELGRLLQEDA